MGLATKPYYHLQVPLVLSRFDPVVHERDRPKVLHAPSNASIKGTAKIEAALDQLADEGIDFEYTRIEGLKHDKLCELLSEADVVVDELILHGPGWLSMEAMASGCVAATRYLEDSPECFRPAVVPIDHHTLYPQLKKILTDKELRTQLANAGVAYTREHNSIGRVVDLILERAQSPHEVKPDYTSAGVGFREITLDSTSTQTSTLKSAC